MTKFLKTQLVRNKFKSSLVKKKSTMRCQERKIKEEKRKSKAQLKKVSNKKEISEEKPRSKKQNLDKNKKQKSQKEEEKVIVPQVSLESIKDHFYIFSLLTDLYTILYTTLIFKWIQTDRLLILVNDNKIGYKIEIFLKSFKINCCFLDNEMPVNTNNHFSNNFLKGNFKICISNKTFNCPSPNFVDKIIETSPIPVSVIYFDFLDSKLLNDHSFRINIKSIHHLISFENNKNRFSSEYNSLDRGVTFQQYEYNKDQVAHLRYRCEDIYHSIKKSDIKKAKTKKINQELLHSKEMEKYFEQHPEEKLNVINAIKENNYYTIKASANYLPSYLIHEESKENKIEQAILNNYGGNVGKPPKKLNDSNLRRKKKSKLQEYFECLERNDGSDKNIIF